MPIPNSLLNTRIITSQSISMYPSLCTIYDKNDSTEDSGSEVPGVPTPAVGMVDIPCRVAPIILIRPTDVEERRDSITREYENRTINLFGYFPQIDKANQHAV